MLENKIQRRKCTFIERTDRFELNNRCFQSIKDKTGQIQKAF